ncbi:MAG: NTP transferase domain-containing protein [Candidatus Zambryskibacteria bacterium]|nr:NTP transferase domain-containing protein [Candidatus Zambryskibacteria bacterium]
MNNKSYIILAAGLSTRLYRYGTLLPKFLLPISKEENLLNRNLRQIREIDKTNHVYIITKSEIGNIIEKEAKKFDAKIIIPEDTSHPLRNVLYANKYINNSMVTLCLADIFFLNNQHKLEGKSVNILNVAKPKNVNDLKKGGIVIGDNGIVNKIFENPRDDILQGFKWTGLATFSSEFISYIPNVFLENKNPRIGDLFDFCMTNKNISFEYNECDFFINVNTYDEYLACQLKNITSD